MAKSKSWRWFLLTTLLGGLVLSCTETLIDPPRDNVLDKQNPETGKDPFGLTAMVGAITVTLNWQAVPSTAVAYYSVKRSTGSSGIITHIGGVPASVTSFQDASVQAGATYPYKVAARDADGAKSEI